MTFLTLLLVRKVINVESLFSRRNNHHLLTRLKSLTEIRKNLSCFFLGILRRYRRQHKLETFYIIEIYRHLLVRKSKRGLFSLTNNWLL